MAHPGFPHPPPPPPPLTPTPFFIGTQILSARLFWYLQDFVTLYQNFNEKGLALVAFPWSATQNAFLCFVPTPVSLPALA